MPLSKQNSKSLTANHLCCAITPTSCLLHDVLPTVNAVEVLSRFHSAEIPFRLETNGPNTQTFPSSHNLSHETDFAAAHASWTWEARLNPIQAPTLVCRAMDQTRYKAVCIRIAMGLNTFVELLLYNNILFPCCLCELSVSSCFCVFESHHGTGCL